MGASSGIEWTDATWPVVKGCDYVSPGCANCYAVDLIHRHAANPNPKIGLPLAGLTEVKNGRPRWTGKVYLNEPHLMDPLKWKKGRMIFVPSHGDLFHEDVPQDFIDRVFAVMACCPHHTFQVLTKRADRMAEYVGRMRDEQNHEGRLRTCGVRPMPPFEQDIPWPLPNVWLGVSAENRQHGLPRVDVLRDIPAAVRFLSVEPLLEDLGTLDLTGIHWVIVGGESGHGARMLNVEWVRSIVRQCRDAGVPAFVKQLGALPVEVWAGDSIAPGHGNEPPDVVPLELVDKKGGDPSEWPADLRVREFPAPAEATP